MTGLGHDRGLMQAKVSIGLSQEFSVVSEHPQSEITRKAEKPTDRMAGPGVAMVHHKLPFFRTSAWRIPADRTDPILGRKNLFVPLRRDPVIGSDVAAVVGLSSLRRSIQSFLLSAATDFATSLQPVFRANGGMEFTPALDRKAPVAEFVPGRNNRGAGAIRGEVSREPMVGPEPRMAVRARHGGRVLFASPDVGLHLGPSKNLVAVSARSIHAMVHRFSRLQVSRTARRIASASFTRQRSASFSRFSRSSLERLTSNCRSLGCIQLQYRPERKRSQPLCGAKGESNENFRGCLPRERGGRLAYVFTASGLRRIREQKNLALNSRAMSGRPLIANSVNCWEAYGYKAMVISSQARQREGSTAIPTGSTAKRLEAQRESNGLRDMVSSTDESRSRAGVATRFARASTVRMLFTPAIHSSSDWNRRTESLSPETPECPKRLTNNSRLVAGATTEKSRELRETLQPITAMAIRSQAGEIRTVQRLSLRGVQLSGWKRETPRTGDEIAWSHAKA